MKSETLNGVITYAPNSRKELIDYAVQHKKILVAVNAEKILHATDQSRAIINRNLGYPDGIGAVWALHKKVIKTSLKFQVVNSGWILLNNITITSPFI